MNLRVLFGLMLMGIAAHSAAADVALPQGVDADVNQAEAISPATAPQIMKLSKTLQIDGILAVMRDEGFDYGKSLEEEMFPGKGGTTWTNAVGQIYDEAAMKAKFEKALVAELGSMDPKSIDVMDAFFASDRGRRILAVEVKARHALLDQDTEDAAKATVEDMANRDDPRLAQIHQFADANDLIEMNVAGALNANLAFFKGMSEAGGFDEKMTEEQMLSNVWAQEPDIRSETETWLYPYLALAYQQLSDDDMQAYLAFSDMAEGKALNAAVFAAFNTLFTDISANLGRAAAKHMHGQDI